MNKNVILKVTKKPSNTQKAASQFLAVYLVINMSGWMDNTTHQRMASMESCHKELATVRLASNATAWCEER